MKKRTLALIIAVVTITSATTGCSAQTEVTSDQSVAEQLTVPDIVNTEELVAKNILSSNGLIPVVETEYNDDIEAGKIIRTSPDVGQSVEKNSKVTIYVSKGVKYIVASNSNLSYHSISNEKDNWEFQMPYIDEGTLYIECYPLFMEDVKWYPYTEEMGGIGRASISDTFDKTVPISIITSQETIKAGERGEITLKIPLSDLDVQQPTTMYVQLAAYLNGDETTQKRINIGFVFSW